MSIRSRAHLWVVFVILIFFAVGSLAAASNSGAVVLLMVPVLIVHVIMMNRLRCPNCRKIVYQNPYLGFDFGIVFTPWVPRNCSRCGYPLDKEGN